jgi:hypothetical protein
MNERNTIHSGRPSAMRESEAGPHVHSSQTPAARAGELRDESCHIPVHTGDPMSARPVSVASSESRNSWQCKQYPAHGKPARRLGEIGSSHSRHMPNSPSSMRLSAAANRFDFDINASIALFKTSDAVEPPSCIQSAIFAAYEEVVGQVDVRSTAVDECGARLGARCREVLRIEDQRTGAAKNERRPPLHRHPENVSRGNDARSRTLEWTIVSNCSDGSDRRRHQCAQLSSRQCQHSALATSDADGFGKWDKRNPRNSIRIRNGHRGALAGLCFE